jgi:hypothetical protein
MDIRISQESGKPVAANVAGLVAALALAAQQAVAVVSVEATEREVATEPRRAQLAEQMPVYRAVVDPAAEREADAELQQLRRHRHFHREFLHQA